MSRFLTCASGHFWVPDGPKPSVACPICEQPSTLVSQLRCLQPRAKIGGLLIMSFLLLLAGPGLITVGLVGLFIIRGSGGGEEVSGQAFAALEGASLLLLVIAFVLLALVGTWLWRRQAAGKRQGDILAATLNFRCQPQLPAERRQQAGQWPFCQEGNLTVSFWAEGFFRDAHLALLDVNVDGAGKTRQLTMVLFLDRQSLPDFQLLPLAKGRDHWDLFFLELVGLRKPQPDHDWTKVYKFQLDPGPEGRQLFRPTFTTVVGHNPFLSFACRDGLLAVAIASCSSTHLPLFVQTAWELQQRLLTGRGDIEGIEPP